MCGVFVLASRFTSTTLKITHFPSGETSGSPTRLSFIMSSKVKGCLAWETAGAVNPSARRKRQRWRMKEILRLSCKHVAGYVFDGSIGAVGKTLQATSLHKGKSVA